MTQDNKNNDTKKNVNSQVKQVEAPKQTITSPAKKLKLRKQPYRQVINPKQTQKKSIYKYNNISMLFDKKEGYFFSFDKSMDEVVEYFRSKGFTVNEQKNYKKEDN